MKSKYYILLNLIGILCLTGVNAQITLDSCFKTFRRFVAVDYSNKDLRTIKKWSDSTYIMVNKKKGAKHQFFKGSLKCRDNVIIEFDILISSLKLSADERCGGTICIYGDDQPFDATKYSSGFDSVYIKYDSLGRVKKRCLYFYNYDNSTNQVLERVDTSLSVLLKREYYDFYFADLDKRTSKWQVEFKTFMQPYSDGLIALIRRRNIAEVFDIIGLRNKGYSWFLVEGLWYYNELHPCLTKEQMKIIDRYNGKNGMIPFRSEKDLEKVYNF